MFSHKDGLLHSSASVECALDLRKNSLALVHSDIVEGKIWKLLPTVYLLLSNSISCRGTLIIPALFDRHILLKPISLTQDIFFFYQQRSLRVSFFSDSRLLLLVTWCSVWWISVLEEMQYPLCTPFLYVEEGQNYPLQCLRHRFRCDNPNCFLQVLISLIYIHKLSLLAFPPAFTYQQNIP